MDIGTSPGLAGTLQMGSVYVYRDAQWNEDAELD